MPDITALWFEQQLEIEEGNIQVNYFLDNLEIFIEEQIKQSKEFSVELKGEMCDVCGQGIMQMKKSKDNNYFLACSNFPDCKSTKSLLNNKSIPNCPCCGKSSLRLNTKALSCQCGFTAWRTVANKNITEAQLFLLATKGRTNKINGFKNKAGKEFAAALILDKTQKKVSFLFNK